MLNTPLADNAAATEIPAADGDGAAAVNPPAPDAPVPDTPAPADAPNVEKTTPKAVSEAVNRAVSRYKIRLDEREQLDAAVAERLRDFGLPDSICEAAEQLTLARTHPVSNRDLELLGEAEAARAVADGSWEELRRALLDKPVEQRTRRDRACFLALEKQSRDAADRAALARIGVEPEALAALPAYVEFSAVLDPDLSAERRYELYLRYAAPRGSTPAAPPPLGGGAASAGSRFIAPARVDSMTPEQVRDNLPDILASMPGWYRK